MQLLQKSPQTNRRYCSPQPAKLWGKSCSHILFHLFFLDFEIFTWNLSPEVPKGPRFTECSSYWSHFPCQLALAPLKLQETSDFFVSSCSSPGLFLLLLHFVEFSFPIFLHFSLLAEILPQLLWGHTFISSRLGWLAFGSHSSWPSLMGCVPLSLHPSHLHTKGENWEKKTTQKTELELPELIIFNLHWAQTYTSAFRQLLPNSCSCQQTHRAHGHWHSCSQPAGSDQSCLFPGVPSAASKVHKGIRNGCMTICPHMKSGCG